MPERAIVHLVHGTWGAGLPFAIRQGLRLWPPLAPLFGNARPLVSSPANWFEPDSPFVREVKAALGTSQAGAVEFVPFRWSGSNSFRAREDAASRFREHLKNFIGQYPDARHLIVCHSHGGNVAVQAVGSPDDSSDWSRIAGILTMASPFLGRRKEQDPNRALYLRISLVLALVMFVTVTGYYLSFGRSDDIWVALLMTVTALGATWLPAWQGWKSRVAWVHAGFWLSGWLLAIFALPPILSLTPNPEDLNAVGAVPIMRALGFASWCGLVGVITLSQWCRGLIPKPERMCLEDISRSALQMFLMLVIFAPLGIIFVLSNATPRDADPPSAMVAMILPFMAACFVMYLPNRWKAWLAKSNARDWSDPLYRLPCRLTALRMPSDEAALAISTGQVVGRMGEFIFTTVLGGIRQSWSVVFFRPNDAPRYLRWLIWSYVGGCCLVLAFAAAVSAAGASAWLLLLFLPLLVPFFLFFAHLMLILFTFPIWWLSATLLSLSVGPDVLFQVPAYAVDCEPLPKCSDPGMSSLYIDWTAGEQRQSSLRHSIHTLSSVRGLVADWLAWRLRSQ